MKISNAKLFLKKSTETLDKILNMLDGLPAVHLEDLTQKQTALIIVDMINGFAREGALSSPRVEKLIPEITELMKKCCEKDISMVAFADSHTIESPEFDAYPVHCLAGTYEEEVVKEIKDIGGYKLIPKNSTNGFHEKGFHKWLEANKCTDTFIVTGDCTDICIEQFAVTLKTWFNMQNRKSRVIVPVNAVETYDLGLHDGDLINVMSLYNMITNGIEVVSSVEN